jgi:hypothetical protein
MILNRCRANNTNCVSDGRVEGDTPLLNTIVWNIRQEPRKAENEDSSGVDLSALLFDAPTTIELYDRYGNDKYHVPMFSGTIGDVFAAIHGFYEMYECEEEGRMGDGIFFEGLSRGTQGVTVLYLGS